MGGRIARGQARRSTPPTPSTSGIASLQAHEAYLAGLEGHPDVAEFLAEWARLAGDRLGCTYAASFEVYSIRLL